MANQESTAVHDLIERVRGPRVAPSQPVIGAIGLTPMSVAPIAPPPALDSTWVVTTRRVVRFVAGHAMWIAVVALGAFTVSLVGYRLLLQPDEAGGDAAAAVAPALQPAAPVAPPVIAPPPAPKPEPAPPVVTTPAPTVQLVDLRLDSRPAGAEVTLVDGTKSSPLGTTPLHASVDPTHHYDLVFTKRGVPTRIEHIDPKTTQHLAVVLETQKPVAKAKAKRAAKKKTKRGKKSRA